MSKTTNGVKMVSTGVTRPFDDLGRVVIPVELRRTLGIGEGTRVEIFVEGEDIILRKYQRGCIFCGNVKEVTEYKGQAVCLGCALDLGGKDSADEERSK